MNTKTVHVKNCLLGYGYASLIAYHKLLKTNNHEDILILRNENSTPIFSIEHEGTRFSPLPIFPVEESELYNSDLFDDVPKQKPISVSFSELTNFNYKDHTIEQGSLASFMLSNQGIDQRLCLGLKQWGDSMLSKPFSQVQDKIKRHYISKSGNTRIGYVNGKSIFKYAINKLNPEVLNFANLQKIDIEKKEVHTNDSIIKYEKLVSTIPFHYLLDLCGLKHNHNTDYASAYFYFFKYKDGFDENQVVYDCDFNSDILRIFSIKDDFLLAQLRSDKQGQIPIEKIRKRVQELVPSIKELEFAQELFVPMSYPLELVTEPSTLESIDTLKENGVVPFGRFGEWGYSDLHELDWSTIY